MLVKKKYDISNLHILILNGDLPVFPGWGGIEFLHTTRFAKLAKKVGLVSVVQTPEQDEKKIGLSKAGVNLFLWTNPNLFSPCSPVYKKENAIRQILKTIYTYIRVWPPRPQDTLIQDFQMCNISKPLHEALKKNRWNAVIVIQSSSAHWLDCLPSYCATVLVLHDVRALMFKRRAYSSESMYRRLSYLLQYFLYKKFEGKFCKKYDLVVTVSKTDQDWVKKYYRPEKLITVPIPVDSEYFHPLIAAEPVENLIVFTGMMNHPPNSDAAGFFARHIYPVVKAAIPSAKFNIVGRNPTEEVRILEKIDGVKVTGFVPDIRPYIAQANIIVVPLRFGAGMRQKILEAWAMEKCVVSTRIGAEGLDCEDNNNILIADEAETMARKIIHALQDPAKVEQIAKKGRDTVVKQHNPDMLAQNYFDAVESVINEKFAANKPLRVLIDLRWMVPGIAGGIENLSRSFLNCLLEIDKYNKYSILLPTAVKHDFDLRKNNNFHLIQSDGLASTFEKISNIGARLIHSRLKIPYWRSQEVETLTHSKAFNADIALSIPGYIHPELHTMTNVLIVPDIQHEFCPEFFSKQEFENRKRLYTESIHIADHLCAISEFTRQTLIEVLGVPAERITTTHLAADPIFHTDSIYRGIYRDVLPKYKLEPGQYLLFPGNTWLHKNHLRTLEALRILREEYHLEPQLVCTGTLKDAQSEIMNLVKRYRLERQVNFLGYCPSIDMPSLYEGSFGMIFPSIFEGFGIPLLEAMWCNCPIACSNVTSLPEIAGDAAIMFDPHSIEAIAHAFNRLLTESETRSELVKKGLEQAKKFSWIKFTTEVTRILHEVYTENKSLEHECT